MHNTELTFKVQNESSNSLPFLYFVPTDHLRLLKQWNKHHFTLRFRLFVFHLSSFAWLVQFGPAWHLRFNFVHRTLCLLSLALSANVISRHIAFASRYNKNFILGTKLTKNFHYSQSSSVRFSSSSFVFLSVFFVFVFLQAPAHQSFHSAANSLGHAHTLHVASTRSGHRSMDHTRSQTRPRLLPLRWHPVVSILKSLSFLKPGKLLNRYESNQRRNSFASLRCRSIWSTRFNWKSFQFPFLHLQLDLVHLFNWYA